MRHNKVLCLDGNVLLHPRASKIKLETDGGRQDSISVEGDKPVFTTYVQAA